MNEVDWVIIAVLVVSGLFSLLRGFVREAMSLVAWFAAFVIAVTMSPKLAPMLSAATDASPLRMIIAFVVLFVGTLIVGGLSWK